MHPSHKDLRCFLKGILDDEISSEIAGHIENCEFCREYCEDYRLMRDANVSEKPIELPPGARKLADRLFSSAMSGKIINLIILSDERPGTERQAADGEPDNMPDIENLATLYSEEPELVLRIMRNHKSDQDYLQLISDETSMISNVMIQIPSLNKKYLTDNNGKATLDEPLENISKLKWQIKIPDANFILEPLKYDPDSVEYSKELEFETERNDKIKVKFEGKTEGKQISIKIIALDGKKNFGEIKVTVAQKGSTITRDTLPNKIITFNLDDSDSEINIRLFQK